jgi:hypothetical protein
LLLELLVSQLQPVQLWLHFSQIVHLYLHLLKFLHFVLPLLNCIRLLQPLPQIIAATRTTASEILLVLLLLINKVHQPLRSEQMPAFDDFVFHEDRSQAADRAIVRYLEGNFVFFVCQGSGVELFYFCFYDLLPFLGF